MPDDASLTAGPVSADEDEERRRERALFAGTLSALGHELRTPLTTVLGALNMLERTPLSPEQLQLIVAAEHAGRRLETWIDNVGDVIEPGRSSRTPQPRAVDIAAELQPVVEYCRLDARDVGAFVELDTSMMEARERWCDRRMFRQAAISLFDSALKCTSGGELCVSAADEDDQVSIVVGPYGVGWEPTRIAFARRILEGDIPAEASRDGGVGIGLAVAKRLAARLNGDLVLRHAGTSQEILEFTFHAPPTERMANEGSLSAQDIGCKNVLVVEESAVDQRLVRAMLTHLGHETTIAPTAADALSHVDAATFDLVILGLEQVEGGGLQVAQSIRGRGGPIAGVPMMAMVADEGGPLQDKALEVGIDAIVSKPLHLAKLSQAVRRVARWC